MNVVVAAISCCKWNSLKTSEVLTVPWIVFRQSIGTKNYGKQSASKRLGNSPDIFREVVKCAQE